MPGLNIPFNVSERVMFQLLVCSNPELDILVEIVEVLNYFVKR